jgi:hypothetical protein
MKVGGDFSHIPFADDSQVNINGTYQFGADQPFNPNDPASVANLRGPILFTMTTPANYVPMPSQYLGLFVQDDWRPTPSLTINAGLRYDLQIGAFNTDVRPDQFRIPIPLIDPSPRGDSNNFGARRLRLRRESHRRHRHPRRLRQVLRQHQTASESVREAEHAALRHPDLESGVSGSVPRPRPAAVRVDRAAEHPAALTTISATRHRSRPTLTSRVS